MNIRLFLELSKEFFELIHPPIVEDIAKNDNYEKNLEDEEKGWQELSDDEEYEDYVEDRCNGDIECAFSELAYQDIIEKPEVSIDDRYYPDINTENFNEILSDRLSEVEYHYIK